MRTMMRRAAHTALCSASVAVALSLVSQAQAQSTISYSGGTYTQDFNTLPSSGSFPLAGNGPFDLGDPFFTAPGMQGWSFAKYAGSGANASFLTGTGSSTAGAIYSFGLAGESERALGSLASGGNMSRFGAIFVNTGTATLNRFSLSFIGEQWRRGGSGNVNTLSFEYAIDATDINTGSFVGVSGLNFSSVNTSGSGSALNGNDPANRLASSGSASGFSWAPGQTLLIRWSDVDDAGSDDGLAIDDFSFSAGIVRNLVWDPTGAGGNVWSNDAGSMNWREGPTPVSFMEGDIANFTDTGVGMVVVGAGGVEPSATNFSNDTGMYTLTGSTIGGSGALIKTGNGSLLMDNLNTYTGGTVVNGGDLLLKFDQNLGAATAGLTLGGGTVRTLGTIASVRNVTLTESTVSTIDTQGVSNATFSAVSGGGSLIKLGPATLTFTGPYTVSGDLSVLAGTLVLAQPGGTVNLKTGAGSSNFSGDLTIANAVRVNLNAGEFSGGGTIRTQSSGAILSTDGGQQFLAAIVGNNVVLNSNGVPAPFSTTIGATINNSIIFNGVISGDSDVSFASSTPGSGTGVIVLNNNNTWTGTTTINFAQAGVVRLGTDNALPPATGLVFGTGTNSAGALDLAGFNQSLASLASDTTGMVNGIANTGAVLRGGPAILTITGNQTTSFGGTIGVPADATNLPGANDNIALVLSSSHTGLLTLSGINSYSGGTTINGGTLGVFVNENLGNGMSPVNFGGGTLRISGPDFTSARPVNVNAGGGSITLAAVPGRGGSNASFGPVTGPGVLTTNAAGNITFQHVRTGGLNVQSGTVTIATNAAPNSVDGLSRVDTLFIAGGPDNPTAKLDVGNNATIVGATPASDADGGPDSELGVRSYIKSGFDSGGWTGNGITSNATDFGSGNFALGYAEAGPLGLGSYLGFPLNPTDVLIIFTRYGDANLDGTVNLSDFNQLAANFGSTSAVWRQGDFNYDGSVNLTDFNRLAANFGLSAGPDGPTPDDWAALASAVPEPALLAPVALVTLLIRRRRR